MSQRNLTLAEIRAGYTEEKRKEDRRIRLWLYFVLRRISFYLTWIFLRAGISANQVTFFSMIVGFTSCAFLCFSNRDIKIAGAFLANFWLILDCTDGNIARCGKSLSPAGEFNDALAGYIITPFLFMSLGIGASIASDSSVLFGSPGSFLASLNNNAFLIIGFWSSLSYALTRLISLRYKIIMTNVSSNNNHSIIPSNRTVSVIAMVLRNVYGVSGFFMPLLLLSVVFRLLGVLALLYSVVNTSALILIIIKTTVGTKLEEN